VVGNDLIRLQIEIREDTCEHKERTQFRVDQQVILTTQPSPAWKARSRSKNVLCSMTSWTRTGCLQ